MKDMVNHPSHYTWLPGVEAIDIVEPLADRSGWNVANAVKYLLRVDGKGKPLEDLRKAAWYINRELQRRSKPDVSATGKTDRRAGRKPTG